MDRLRRLLKRGEVLVTSNRFIFVSNAIPDNAVLPDGFDKQKFSDNEIVSSKYTVWNFLPKNLFEQFRRLANFYFLCVGIITLLIDSPVSPITTFLPLVFVVVVTGIKQGYEDYLRHKSDRQVNLQEFEVVRNGKLQNIKSKDIHVGDIVRVEDDESFPCDLILISSSNSEGKCYITTANLDGETNYKVKNCPKMTRDLNAPETLDELRAHMEYEQPDVNLYQFIGQLIVYSNDKTREDFKTDALGMDNLLLRGARLKDTDHIYGCAVYTGQDTKLALNSVLKSNKFSTVEKSMNWFLIAFLVLLIVEICLCTMQKYLVASYFKAANDAYLGPEKETTFMGVLVDMSGFMVIFNYIIPISLYVTLELQKFLGSIFFVWDKELYCPIAEEYALCNTSDLNEELGQVQYLLTDKTGTLTENCMEFRQCSINGRKYVDENGTLMKAYDNSAVNLEPVAQFSPEEEQFLTTLALCHTVNITGSNNKKRKPSTKRTPTLRRSSFRSPQPAFEYQASSPDEKALAEACQRFGIVYCGEEDSVCTVSFNGEKRSYRRLHVLEFDSDRKRMSVIVQFPDDSIWVLCKGAENTVLPVCAVGEVDKTEQHIKDYAMLGLRTLAIAARQLSPAQYQELNEQLQEARQALIDRDSAVGKVFKAIESNLVLLGATGVEDQLQEGVAETLESLKAAGICTWVLTGDKLETAVNIAFSCGHFKRTMEILELSGTGRTETVLNDLRAKISNGKGNHFGMVIDGQSLAEALNDHRSLLSDVAEHCEAVVCCRMSPLQKAEVVKLVKEFPSKPTTAAVGDGANDVSMIQEAHIGLGIMGKEGRQAVRCSDFAFARFRFLRRALLVHGHWYYWRISNTVQYFFYKNIVFNTPVVFFTIFSAYSTQPVYSSILFTMFNITFTALPIFIYGLFDQNFNDRQLLDNLHLYRTISRNSRMSWLQFLKWNLLGLWHAIVIYFGVHLLFYYQCDVYMDGKPLDLIAFGTIICKGVAWVTNIKLLIESRYWTIIYTLSIFLSVAVGFTAFMFFYCGVSLNLIDNMVMKWIFMVVEASGGSWILMFLLMVICLLPDILVGMAETYFIRDGVVASRTPADEINDRLNQMWAAIKQRSKVSYSVSDASSTSRNSRVVDV